MLENINLTQNTLKIDFTCSAHISQVLYELYFYILYAVPYNSKFHFRESMEKVVTY
jgi:hypothetical protein